MITARRASFLTNTVLSWTENSGGSPSGFQHFSVVKNGIAGPFFNFGKDFFKGSSLETVENEKTPSGGPGSGSYFPDSGAAIGENR